VRLPRALEAVETGKVDPTQFASRNRGISPHTLFGRLATRAPREDLVVAHGDATLSNILVEEEGAVGFIDCGQVGRADRYLDLAVLAAEIVDRFGPAAVRVFAKAYGIHRWNVSKAAYYADLYELF
jgi:aminoglycoside phosphotransferase